MKQIEPFSRLRREYLPVALVRRSLTRFAREREFALSEDKDDLDKFTVAHFELNRDCDFLLLHHAGADEETFDIWLPTDIGDPSSCLLDVIEALRVDHKDIILRQLNTNAFVEQRRRA